MFPLIKQLYGKGINSPENRIRGNGVDISVRLKGLTG
jgi:hypothetical protein